MVDNIESCHLALKPDTCLFLSLHKKVARPQDYFEPTRQHANLAIMDSTRIISRNQLIAAANMAVIRQSKHQTLAWDTVFQASSSSHVGHVLRDNCFGPDSKEQNDVSIVAIGVGGSKEEFASALSEVGFKDPEPLGAYFAGDKSPDEIANFCKWYKLTTEEVKMSSLEQAVLTKVAAKYV